MEKHSKNFKELSKRDFHEILRQRINVFVVEQDCPYPELDGKDPESLHCFIKEGNEILAYARVLPAGLSYKEVSIGRVLVNQSERKKGLGHTLMAFVMDEIVRLYGKSDIRISAQDYLIKFYEFHGFKSTGKSYLEDGIPHTEMLYKNEK